MQVEAPVREDDDVRVGGERRSGRLAAHAAEVEINLTGGVPGGLVEVTRGRAEEGRRVVSTSSSPPIGAPRSTDGRARAALLLAAILFLALVTFIPSLRDSLAVLSSFLLP